MWTIWFDRGVSRRNTISGSWDVKILKFSQFLLENAIFDTSESMIRLEILVSSPSFIQRLSQVSKKRQINFLYAWLCLDNFIFISIFT